MTIVMSIPTIVTSFYGMNVPLPLQTENWASLAVIGIFMAISAVVIIIFLKRDWF